ncbi:CHASE2 domain-containing protein [Oscillatoria sp. FACHB-1407]|uniref:CHASE2 domain-containing protein n=1 Tax=Oscillatoria sp. FACHB-1407 TaxID=2692847 RepID=UPI001689A266|nr:CHASE2 domain-containing protein [Oscillatoria sp. FACHB-1407]MBD2463375.1 CHASE2 domain-containing protein [Oscillatoria sp. FACHB-1407]
MGRPVLFTSLTLTALLLGLRYLGAFQGMELSAYDHLIRSQPDEGEDERLLIVGITEDDVQRLQEWPISDRTLAELLRALEAQQPRVIGLDVMRDIPIGEGREELLQILQQSDRVITVCKVSASDEPGTPPPPDIPADRVSFADLVVDPGGTLRRALLLVAPPPADSPNSTSHFCSDPSTTLVSFSLQVSLHYLATQQIKAELTPEGVLRLGSTSFRPFQPSTGAYQSADAAGFQLMLDYRSPDNVATQVSLSDVLEGRVDPALIRDRIVLIGYTTPEAKDDFYTPYSAGEDDDQKMAGVVVHAQVVSQLLSAVLDGRSSIWTWSNPAEILWIFGWSLAGGVLAWYARHPLKFGGAMVVVIGGLYGVCWLVFLNNGWIPLIPPAVAFVITAAGTVLVDRFNKSTYGQNVYRQVKTFLKLNIEIDQEKLEKQVSEITETDYFQDLQQRAKNLRGQRNDMLSAEELSQPQVSETSSSEPKDALESDDDDDMGYLKNLQQKAQLLRDKRDTVAVDESTSPEQTETSDTEFNVSADDDYEIGYLQQLQQEAKRLRDQGDRSND